MKKKLGTIKVCNSKFSVYIGQSDHMLNKYSNSLAGMCMPQAQEIHISNLCSFEQRVDTTCHELLHAILALSGAGEMISSSNIDEETFIQVISPHLAASLKDLYKIIGKLHA